METDNLRKLGEIMAGLRAPGGCPWDIEQTHDSLKNHLIEEAYEVVDAIEHGDDEHLKEELGDLLLQVFFHAQIAADRGAFTIDDVAGGISEKLVRRHPHIFADGEANTPEDVSRNWEVVKESEGKYDESRLAGIPRSLPALLRAYKTQKKMAGAGFDWPDTASLTAAMNEEAEELAKAMAGDGDIREEIGDMLFMLTNVARQQGIEPEGALRAAIAKVERRFRYMERKAAESGSRLEDMTLENQDKLWDEAKEEER